MDVGNHSNLRRYHQRVWLEVVAQGFNRPYITAESEEAMNHARIKEIATKFAHDDPDATIAERIESAILRAIEELLTAERAKDAAVMHMTAKLCALPVDDNERISRSAAMELVVQWRMKWDAASRMSAQLLKEIKNL